MQGPIVSTYPQLCALKTRAMTTDELTLYHTILTFNDPRKKPLENIVGKGENAGNQHFLLFPTLFSTLSKTNFKFLFTFILSPADAFNLDQSKILSFGKELIMPQTAPCQEIAQC